ncbi:MAG: hypothetical protein PHY15_02015 [Eubacteriales bacterium]|nr:hypothetical protein [Eubacteriales bacterium]MDD4475624.1 hypothetical protein [Eubacteriales bacterium]
MAFTVNTTLIEKAFKPGMLDFVASSVLENGAADSCVFTVDSADDDVIVFVNNQTYVGGSTIDVEFSSGDFWAAKKYSGSDLSVLPGMTAAYVIESAAVKGFDGKVTMTLKPVTASVSLGGIGVSVAVLEIKRSVNN